jgi:hypothetical protein
MVKQVDEQPAIHPHQIQVMQPAHVGKPKHREDDTHKLNLILHEGLKKDIRESEDMIKDMREELDRDARTVHAYAMPVGGGVAALLLCLTLLLLCLCLRYKRNRPAAASPAMELVIVPGSAPPQTGMETPYEA